MSAGWKRQGLNWLIAGAVLMGASLGWADQPNIVFILADDMGYGDVGVYNARSKIPTPNLDRLAQQGMRFTDAHAGGSLCHPSRYALMTGQYPFRVDTSLWRERPLIEEGQVTLPALLRDQGYATSMVGKWHLGFWEEGYDKPMRGGPVDRGFDTFFGLRASTDIPPYFYIRDRRADPPTDHIDESGPGPGDFWSNIQGRFWREGGIAPGLKLEDVLPRLTDEAVSVIKGHATSHSQKPLFLYVAFTAPHTPWLPSEEFSGQSGAGMYGDFTMMVDAMAGKVLQALKENGLEDDTIVFFSSDNGPVWYQKDVDRFEHDSAGYYRGMKGDIWEAGHRVPFIVRWPGIVKPGSISDQTIGFVDLVATAAEISGAVPPGNGAEDSRSFLSVLKGEQPDDQPVHDGLVMHAGKKHLAIREGPWKLINLSRSGGFSDGLTKNLMEPAERKPENQSTGQLYNLARDPGETNNLWDEYPEIVKRLMDKLDQTAGN